MVKCPGCEGTGKVPLFTGRADCDLCKGEGRVLSEEEREKQRRIVAYIRTPEGRRKLAACISPPVRGPVDYPSSEG